MCRLPSEVKSICAMGALWLGAFGLTADATIIHRWSFTETSGPVIDSIGGANGEVVVLGTNSTRANGAITLAGGDRATTDYVQLPGGLVHALTNVTVELWATPNAGETWSRIFDFGPGNDTQAGTFFLSWCRGSTSLSQQRFEFNSPATWTVDTGLATTAGAQHQYVVTWSAHGATNGGGLAQWYRDGALIGSTNTGAVNIANVNDAVLWLGRSQYTADMTASATYNEARIYNHAMSPTEINIDRTNGPDNLIAPPTQVSGLAAAAGSGAGTASISWTPGAGAAGTLVVMNTNLYETIEPTNGSIYAGSSAFGMGTNLGNGNYAVYLGTGSRVTVNNLTPGVTYYVTAYSYSAGGAVYNLQAPPTVSVTAIGAPSSISLVAPAQLPFGSTTQADVRAEYGNGGTGDVTASSTFSSSAPSVIRVSAGGTLQAVGFGSAIITATFQGLQSTQTVTVPNPLISNLIHRYSFTTDASDSVGTANGTLEGNAVVTNGKLVLDGVNSYLMLPPNLVTNETAITMEAWVTDNGSAGWARIFDFGSGTTAYMFLSLPSGLGNLRGAHTISGNGNEEVLQWPNGGRPPVGQESHVVWTTDGATGVGYLYVNGQCVGTNSAMTLTPASLGPTPNDWLGRSQFPGDPYFEGSIDEFRIYNVALPPSIVSLNYSNGPSGLQLTPIVRPIAASPTNVVYTGTTVTLSENPGGVPPFEYQWESNGVTMAGATNSQLVLAGTVVADSASYAVAVANAYGTNVSASLALTVLPPGAPVFNQEPAPAASTNYAGGFASLSAAVAGSPPIALQWSLNGAAIAGATTPVLNLANLQAADAGTYTLTASNAFGATNSAAAALVVLPAPAAATRNVFTYHNDNTRQGAATNEVYLTPANVNTNHFGRLFSYAVDGYVYTQPLIVANVAIPGEGARDVVYVATEHDTVYAFDANSNSGINGGLIWSTNLGVSAVSATAPFGGRYTGGGYTDVVPEVGATGTPVIDPASGTLYVDAFTHEGTAFIHRIHALSITNGSERPNSPVVVAGSVAGKGVDSVNGTVTFSAAQSGQRAALTLANGRLYAAYASYADTDPYHGWVFAYNATNLAQGPVGIYNTTPNASAAAFGAHAAEGGIWQGGGGLCVDAQGNLYFETGNGSFSANTNGGDYADSFVKLSTTNGLAVADYFTPYNQADLAAGDTDLGSGGPILLPDYMGSTAHPHLLLGGGKQGTVYLIDRDTNMGRFNAGGDTNLQAVAGANNGVWSPPACWNGLIYYQASSGPLNCYGVTNGAMGKTAASQGNVSFGLFNGGPVVSANGTENAIVWVINATAFLSSGAGVLYAFNATNLAQQLYNSSQLPARDSPGGAVKMTTPTVSGGKVYVGAEYALSVYGLELFLDAPLITPAGGAFTSSVTVTLGDSSPGASIYYTLDGTAPTTNSILYSGPFRLGSNAVVQAIAIQAGAVSSAISSASFVNTAAAGRGTGLSGEYYASHSSADAFAGNPTLTRTDATVDFNWGGTGPDPLVGATNFTVKWTGTVQAQFDEPYTFFTTSDDGARLYINGQLLIDDWRNQAPTTTSNTIQLAAQQLYNVELDYYYSNDYGAQIALGWSSASTPVAIIPQSQLYPQTNPPPAVALLAPVNGSTYTASASVTLTADADAVSNLIASVSFYANGVFLGAASNAPYTLTATGLGAGAYTLTAVAEDGSGLMATSAPVSIMVNAGSGLAYGLTNRAASPAFFNMPTTYNGALPALLSQTGVFSDTPSMTPAGGLIPYAPNTPLWSDGAVKTRYFSVPHAGGPATPAEQISFAPTNSWTFPAGTVFVKTFQLNTDAAHPNALRRLETRLLVRDINGQVYGVTYKWRADNSDADLLSSSLTENIAITNAAGATNQSWYYPSPADCLTCHTAPANYVLGVNTRQLNAPETYPETGVTDNQLRALNRIGLFNPAFDEAAISGFEQLSALTNTSASLEQRARSYLDANCAQCHLPGGTGITFDARYDTPLTNQNIINTPAAFSLGYDNARIVAPRDVWRSVLYDRINSVDASNAPSKIQMPPLARNVIDTNAVVVMAAWINSLPGVPALAPPTLIPDGGSFVGQALVAVAAGETNASIRYTLDGSLPTTNSALYAGPFRLTTNATVSASAFAAGFINSVAASAYFQVQPIDFLSENFSNNVFLMSFLGANGSNYALQASVDLTNWVSLSTNTGAVAPVELEDPGATNFRYRFYRVVRQ